MKTVATTSSTTDHRPEVVSSSSPRLRLSSSSCSSPKNVPLMLLYVFYIVSILACHVGPAAPRGSSSSEIPKEGLVSCFRHSIISLHARWFPAAPPGSSFCLRHYQRHLFLDFHALGKCSGMMKPLTSLIKLLYIVQAPSGCQTPCTCNSKTAAQT